MNRRPKAGESEEDLLRLQEQFLAEKAAPSAAVKRADKRKAPSSSSSNAASNFAPSGGNEVHKDIVTLPDLPPVLPTFEAAQPSHPQKRSKFKAGRQAANVTSGPYSGQRVTLDLNDDEDDDPEAAMDRHDTHITKVLSKIMEHDTRQQPVFLPQPTSQAFPTAPHIPQSSSQSNGVKTGKKRSLFAQQFESTPPVQFGMTLAPPMKVTIQPKSMEDRDVVSMETEDLPPSHSPVGQSTAPSALVDPSTSSILDGSGLVTDSNMSSVARQQAQEISSQNLEKMAAMTEEEILQEQAKLKAMLDPNLVTFLQSRHKKGTPSGGGDQGLNMTIPSVAESAPSKSVTASSSLGGEEESGGIGGGGEGEGGEVGPSEIAVGTDTSSKMSRGDDEEMDTTRQVPSAELHRGKPEESQTQPSGATGSEGSQTAGESTLKVPFDVKKKWLNMKMVEEDKLEWISELPKPSTKSSSGSQARFDFNGQIVSRDSQIPVREGLYHHGREQEIPGYTLEEMFTLSRSAVIQQRVLALQTLARVIYNYRADSLGGELRSPLISRLLKAGVLFLLRWSVDDSNEGVLSAGVEALAALLVQPGDEDALDKIYSWHQGCCVPPMLPLKRTEEEKEEDDDDLLDDDEDDEEEEDDQKQSKPDEHIASQDVIKGLLKMSLLPRLRYILEVVRPTPPVIMNTLSILIRIARHSAEAALEVSKCPRLLDTIFREFLPTSSWQKQDDPVSNLYGHPTVLALKLARVLCLSGRHITATMISKYPLLTVILRYTSMEPTNMNLNVGEAFHLSTEALRTWSACVRYGLACDAYRELYPLIMQQLQLFQRLSVLPLPSTEEEVTCLVHRLQLVRAATLVSLLEGVVQVAGTAAELRARLTMKNDATNVGASREMVSPPPIDWSHVTSLATPLETCAHHWLVEITNCTEVLAPEASSLIASALDFLGTFYGKYSLQPSYNPVDSLLCIEEFVNDTLLPYMKSSSFYSAVHNLQKHSSLKYTPSNQRNYSTHALPSFCCHYDDSHDETPPCVQRTSTYGYGVALFRFTHRLVKLHRGVAPKFEPIVLSCYVIPYLEDFCCQRQRTSNIVGLAEHFSIHEHTAVYYLIKLFQCVVHQVESCKHHSELYHNAAMKLFARLHPGCEYYAHDLMSTILFSTEFLAEGVVGDPVAADLAEFLTFADKETSGSSSSRDPSRGELLHDAYQRLVMVRNLYLVYFGREQTSLIKSRSRYTGRSHEVLALTLPTLAGPLLPLDWPFLPLLQLFSESQKAEMKGQSVKSLPPQIMTAVTDTLRWVFMIETWRPLTLRAIPLAAKVARLFCVFLTASDLFMERWVHHYLAGLLKIYSTEDYMKEMDFDRRVPGVASFHDLYIALLTQYEAVSFGDHLFAHFVLLPLQQRYSVHPRKALWFDHIHVIRTLSIQPSKCLIPIQNFLDPIEEDSALVSLYFSSLVQGKVRPLWSPIMHLVAVHHIVNYVFERREVVGARELDHSVATCVKLIKAIVSLPSGGLRQTLLLYRGPNPSDPGAFTTFDTIPEHRSTLLTAGDGLKDVLQSRFICREKKGTL